VSRPRRREHAAQGVNDYDAACALDTIRTGFAIWKLDGSAMGIGVRVELPQLQ
jgi:hypothetical protein